MADTSGYLPSMLGPVVIEADGVAQTPRPTINFVGCTGADNPTYDRLDITPPAGGGGSSTPWHNVPVVEKSADYTLVSTDYLVVFTGSTAGQTLTLPGVAPAGDSYAFSNESTVPVTISGGGNNIRGAGTYVLQPGYALNVTKSVSAIWTTL